MVPGRGFEPRFTASKAAVLPLDDPGMKMSFEFPDATQYAKKIRLCQGVQAPQALFVTSEIRHHLFIEVFTQK